MFVLIFLSQDHFSTEQEYVKEKGGRLLKLSTQYRGKIVEQKKEEETEHHAALQPSSGDLTCTSLFIISIHYQP